MCWLGLSVSATILMECKFVAFHGKSPGTWLLLPVGQQQNVSPAPPCLKMVTEEDKSMHKRLSNRRMKIKCEGAAISNVYIGNGICYWRQLFSPSVRVGWHHAALPQQQPRGVTPVFLVTSDNWLVNGEELLFLSETLRYQWLSAYYMYWNENPTLKATSGLVCCLLIAPRARMGQLLSLPFLRPCWILTMGFKLKFLQSQVSETSVWNQTSGWPNWEKNFWGFYALNKC